MERGRYDLLCYVLIGLKVPRTLRLVICDRHFKKRLLCALTNLMLQVAPQHLFYRLHYWTWVWSLQSGVQRSCPMLLRSPFAGKCAACQSMFYLLGVGRGKSRLHEKIGSFHTMLVDLHREQVLPRQTTSTPWMCLTLWSFSMGTYAVIWCLFFTAFKIYQLLFWGLWNTESCPGGSQQGKVVGIGSLKLQLAAHRAAFVKVGLPMPSPFSTQESGEGYRSDRMDWD